jgi:ribonuclease P protein component
VSPIAAVDRLRDGRDIAAVLRGRRSRAGHLAVVHVRDADDVTAPPRVAVVASKRVGDAVSRNRAKRLLREASARVSWRTGTDVVLVARAACAGSSLGPVHTEVAALADRLGVVEAAAA